MNKLVSLLLVIFLVSCPQLCRAETLGCCADHCEEAGAPDDSGVPQPQNEAVSCICAGAIKDSSSQLISKAGLGDWSPELLPATSNITSLWFLPPVIRNGAAHGRPADGPLRVHLMLQILRC